MLPLQDKVVRRSGGFLSDERGAYDIRMRNMKDCRFAKTGSNGCVHILGRIGAFLMR